VELNRAVAVAMDEGPERGLELIDALAAAGELDRYHLYHATRAAFLRELDRPDEAREADRRALALTDNPAERALLLERIGA